MSQATYSRIERGKKTPSESELALIAEQLGRPSAELLLPRNAIPGRPAWAGRLEDLFEHRFRIVSLESNSPELKLLKQNYVVPGAVRNAVNARRAELIARQPYWEPSAIYVDHSWVDGRMVVRAERSDYATVQAMRDLKLECPVVYAGCILTTTSGRLVVDKRSSKNVATYAGYLASYGGAFIINDPQHPARPFDRDFARTALREVQEECRAISLEIDRSSHVLVMHETDTMGGRCQFSLQVIFLKTELKEAQVRELGETQEGTPVICGFEDLKDKLLGTDGEQWAPCGLAHHLAWLAEYGPGLPDHLQERTQPLLAQVEEAMRARK